MVPYHDIQDFWYSGHISTALMLIYGLCLLVELYPERTFFRYVRNIWVFVRLPYIWTMMTLFRTHYFIDMTGAVAISGVIVPFAEKLSYAGIV